MIQPTVVMKSKTLPLLLTLVFATHLHAQRGPQDTWYESARVPMPSGCSPHDLIVTPEGTLLLTDTGNDKIHELEANGSLIRSFGSPGSGNGQFNNPVELAMGPNNRIYVTDQDNHRIQILERDGTFVSAFGTNGSGDGQFNQPRGLDISLDNEVFVSDLSNHRVQVFDADGNFLRKWGSLGNLDGQMNKPYSLEVDDAGDVYIVDRENRRVIVFSSIGKFLYKFGTSITSTSWSYSYATFIKHLSSGILATGGETTGGNQNLIRFREKNGEVIKTKDFGHDWWGTWSPFTQFSNGTIVFAHRSSNNLIFLEQTHRTLKPATPKNLPLVDLISVKQPAGTDHLEIKYKITDTDSSTVNCGLLAFKDGGNDLSKVLIPTTFVGSTSGKLGSSTATGTTHTVTWDAATDWDVLFGDVEIAVVAQDDRELMNFHFLTLPATDTNSTALKINRSPVGHGDFKNAWYTLLALGDSGITLDGNEIKSTSGVAFTTSSGTNTNAEGRKYLFNKMNLREATTSEIDRAKEGATSGVINQFAPSHKVGPDERPNKVNEYGFDTGGSGFWVVPQS
jgi:hypothetical protein